MSVHISLFSGSNSLVLPVSSSGPLKRDIFRLPLVSISLLLLYLSAAYILCGPGWRVDENNYVHEGMGHVERLQGERRCVPRRNVVDKDDGG